MAVPWDQSTVHVTERLFDLAGDDEDSRLCRDISDAQCREEAGNLPRLVLAQVGAKLGDAFADPKVVLPWLMGSVGAPTFLTALIVPLRESLALLPQILIGAVIRRFAVRKGFWVIASLVEGLAVLAMAAVALAGFEGAAAGWMIIVLVVAFSAARGVASIAAKDTLGKTVAKGRRGKVGGYAASVSGVAATGVGLYFALAPEAARPEWLLYVLLAMAAVGWFVGALLMAAVHEHPGATDGGRGLMDMARDQIKVIVGDAELQKFLLARTCMTGTALAAPVYVSLAQQSGAGDLAALGWLILATGAAGAVSSAFWGRFADRSSRSVMAFGGLIGGLTGVVTLAALWLAPGGFDGPAPYAIALFILGIGHAGVRVGRKTHIVDIAGGDAKSEYVAVSNTIIGVALLAIGGLTGAVAVLSLEAALGLLTLMALAGAACALRLENAQAT